MLRRISSLLSGVRKNISGTCVAVAPKRSKTFRPGVEEFEARLVPSSVPLHVAGNQLQDPAGNVVILRGVNIASLESYPTGDVNNQGDPTMLKSVDVALNDWHANLVRVTVYPDFWFGHDKGVGLGEVDPTPYRNLVKQIIDKVQANNAYVMLAVWGSDRGNPAAAPALHDLPDAGTTAFWQSAAPLYANNPAVIFDPFNEPHDATWDQWLNGSTNGRPKINDNGTKYDSPGMQGLLDTIRATGATNIVSPEGLNWGSNLSGVNQGFALKDPTGNLMYQLHLYPAADTGNDGTPSVAVRDARVQAVAQYPVFVGEWGTYSDDSKNPDKQNTGAGWPDAKTWTQNYLAWLDENQFSWTAWDLNPNAGPDLIADWNYTPTDYFGAYVKDNLTAHANNPVKTTPTVASAAQASDSPVTGTTTNLSVLGADDGGEASLTYTWTTVNAPADVSFGANGSNAAKNTTVTFTGAGTYTFEATIVNAGGLSTTSDVIVTVSQTLTSIVVTPGSATIGTGASQQLAAQALDQFGIPLAVQPAFTWSLLNGNGTVDGGGFYQAPAAPATETVIAASGGISATALITIGPSLSANASFADVDDWGTGFTGYITVANMGNADINGWTLEFDFTGNITDIWDAQIISHVGNHYVIQNADWDATIAAGQSISFGFNADWGNVQSGPSSYLLNGVAIQEA